jgi:2,4-dienoyl-CoA reductase-like NADH-dependent reductase (Old Yellow Enzyme family)
MGIDGIEVSCGTALFSSMNTILGDVPVEEMLGSMSWWMKPIARQVLASWVGKYDMEEGYNLEAAATLRPAIGDVPLIVVGGMRRLSHMEQVVEQGQADLISMSRPFVREPDLVQRFREGQASVAACQSCNRCAAALVSDLHIRCYCGGFPK